VYRCVLQLRVRVLRHRFVAGRAGARGSGSGLQRVLNHLLQAVKERVHLTGHCRRGATGG
jgi:hypothetical protein